MQMIMAMCIAHLHLHRSLFMDHLTFTLATAGLSDHHGHGRPAPTPPRGHNRPPYELSAAALRTACRDNDELTVVDRIRHRQSCLGPRQWALPDLLTGFLVISMEDSHSARSFTREQEVLRNEQTCLRRTSGRRHVC